MKNKPIIIECSCADLAVSLKAAIALHNMNVNVVFYNDVTSLQYEISNLLLEYNPYICIKDIKDLPNKQSYGWYRKFDKKKFS